MGHRGPTSFERYSVTMYLSNLQYNAEAGDENRSVKILLYLTVLRQSHKIRRALKQKVDKQCTSDQKRVNSVHPDSDISRHTAHNCTVNPGANDQVWTVFPYGPPGNRNN